jgi:hypothetical protein
VCAVDVGKAINPGLVRGHSVAISSQGRWMYRIASRR